MCFDFDLSGNIYLFCLANSLIIKAKGCASAPTFLKFI